MDILAYRDHSTAVVEVFDVIDDQLTACAALQAEVEKCLVPTMIVKLCDPLVTVAALHLLADTERYAHSRDITLQAVVAPSAEHIFHIAGLEYLLRGESE